MATAVLRPQDCASPIAFVPSHASRFVPRSKPKSNPVPNTRRRRRSPSDQKELVMGKVRILKRGDKIDDDRSGLLTVEKVEDVLLCSTDRLGPDPVVVKEEMKISVCEKKEMNKVVVVRVNEKKEDTFAGCVVVASPPPSSLPMPKNFWMKKEKYDPVSISMDLRKLLRLDLF